MSRRLILPPVQLVFFLTFIVILLILPLFFLNVIALAFRKLGIPWFLAYLILWLSLIGSLVNIPVAEMKSEEEIVKVDYVSFLGIVYPVPYIEKVEKTITVALNLGGCIIPVVISSVILGEMVVHSQFLLLIKTIIATLIATIIFNKVARPVRGLGIVMPLFIPPLVSATLAILFAPENPTFVAYVCGTLGTLIGADILNLKKIKRLGASVVSIGGAGTFDGIFLTGVIAVLLVW